MSGTYWASASPRTYLTWLRSSIVPALVQQRLALGPGDPSRFPLLLPRHHRRGLPRPRPQPGRLPGRVAALPPGCVRACVPDAHKYTHVTIHAYMAVHSISTDGWTSSSSSATITTQAPPCGPPALPTRAPLPRATSGSCPLSGPRRAGCAPRGAGRRVRACVWMGGVGVDIGD